MSKRGKFYSFEGIDGAGKSSLINRLSKALNERGFEIESTCEPTKNYLGKHIREILSGDMAGDEKTIAALFLADRIDHITHPSYGMLKSFNESKIVLSDRYYMSSYAYHVPHVTLDWVIEANSICADLMKPDYTFYIDISVAESLARLTKYRDSLDLYENEERISLVRQNYEVAIERVGRFENIKRINGMRDKDAIFEEVLSIILKDLESQ
jgi:dTMP kinase